VTGIQSIHQIALWPTLGLVAVATFTDLRGRRIPNWLVLPFLLLGFALSGIFGGWTGIGQSLLGALAATLVLGAFCYTGGMGMGDLKLCAAIGAWVGPSQLFSALVLTGIAGGAMALCWVLTRLLRGESPLVRAMPYAPAIAVGTICSFLGRNL
jgi:prepilin peptidase CpaA